MSLNRYTIGFSCTINNRRTTVQANVAAKTLLDAVKFVEKSKQYQDINVTEAVVSRSTSQIEGSTPHFI